jgi:DNA polymerase III subunit delta'
MVKKSSPRTRDLSIAPVFLAPKWMRDFQPPGCLLAFACPMRLRDLAGQNHATALLLRAVAARRVAHAYLFDGPTGVGKRSAAVGLGMALACPRAPGEGCGACDVCHRILGGNHPDVRVFLPATAQILIEQAQEIVLLAAGRPHEAPARVIVVDDADRLNPSSANCLLKTLEEPFPGTHLVLVTAAPERLLPTIRSRTQRVRFVPVPAAVLEQIARGRGAAPERAETAAALAAGSVAALGELLGGQAEATLWQVVADLRRAAAARDMGSLFAAAAAAGDKEGKEHLPAALALLGRLYRDALAVAADARDLVLLRGRAADLEPLAAAARQRAGLATLRRALTAVLEADTALAGNANAVLAVERMLLDVRPLEQEAA